VGGTNNRFFVPFHFGGGRITLPFPTFIVDCPIMAAAYPMTTVAPASILFDQGQVAQRLGVSIRSLERWRMTGDGPRYIKMGRQIRYRAEDVEAWIATMERRSTSDGGAIDVAELDL
jgi:predicted DNA-binding transcriptional regulator AlpA